MELEFDKEIDAILRKTRSGSGVSVKTANAHHLDADTIAAFAENALPDSSKRLYMEHFADCDRCRKILSQAIRMNTEAVTSDQGAASYVSAPVDAATIPWYQSIFRTPNLALAMGALVLAFSGFLGYLVLQDGETRNLEVSQVTEPQATQGGPYYGGDDGAANATSSNSMANSANTATTVSNTAATNSTAGMPATESNTTPSTFGRVESAEEKPALSDDKAFTLDGVSGGTTKPVAAAPPLEDQPVKTDREKKESVADEVTLAGKDLQLSKRKQAENRRMDRDAPPPVSKVGPSRSGPLQNQSNQVNSNVFDMAVTRLVAGKSFQNRNGAWYDSAYHGQGTTNVRRGTDAYKKLDGGLRNIAHTLGGIVVVVWKEKAYRIQ